MPPDNSHDLEAPTTLQYMQFIAQRYPPNSALVGTAAMVTEWLDEGADPELVIVVEPRLTPEVEAVVERWTRDEASSFEWFLVVEEPPKPTSRYIRNSVLVF